MTRRRKLVPAKRTALGGGWDTVTKTIATMEQRCIAAMCAPPSAAEIIESHFAPETRHIARMAHGVINEGYSPWYGIGGNGEFRVERWEHFGMAPPLPTQVQRMSSQLAEYIASATLIRDQWARVRFVANWLDDNCTIGAIRYYWPTMKLLTNHADLHQADVEKFRDNPAIAPLLPLLREAATTVAAIQLLPPTPDEDPTTNMTLNLSARKGLYVPPDGRSAPMEYDIPEHIVHLS